MRVCGGVGGGGGGGVNNLGNSRGPACFHKECADVMMSFMLAGLDDLVAITCAVMYTGLSRARAHGIPCLHRVLLGLACRLLHTLPSRDMAPQIASTCQGWFHAVEPH